MDIATGCSTKLDEREAVQEAYAQLTHTLVQPAFIFLLSTVTYNNQTLIDELKLRSVDSRIIGGTSCIGMFTQRGYCSEDKRALGILGINDDNGCFGIAAMELSADPFADGQLVVSRAMADAGRSGELPSLILIISAPGHEESLIQGIMNEVGTDVPIFGGSSADNSISGD